MDSKPKTIIVYLKYKETESWDGRELLREGGLLLWAGHDVTQLIGLNEPVWDEILVSEYSEEIAYDRALNLLKEEDKLKYYKVHLVRHYPQSIIDKMNEMIEARKSKSRGFRRPIKEIFSKEHWEAEKKAGIDHLNFTPDQIEEMLQRNQDIPVVCLNYLKLRDIARYQDDFKGKKFKTGRKAYEEYGKHGQHTVLKLDLFGEFKFTIVGEDEQIWDNFVFVRYPSVKKFIEMITTKDFQDSSIQRSAGLENTILLSITPYNEPY